VSVSECKEITGVSEGIAQRLHFRLVVVQVKAGSNGGVRAKKAHERLGAVVSGADTDIVLIEHLADIVWVNITEGEADSGASHVDIS
jgi:hypothetical protein